MHHDGQRRSDSGGNANETGGSDNHIVDKIVHGVSQKVMYPTGRIE